ncbi:MAG: hypothetical protein V7641_2335 [Blastocatellia bacterium]
MANEEHLNILKQSWIVFEHWREQNPETRLDLKGIDIRDANLVGWDLSNAALSYAHLTKVNLSLAKLTGANLSHAMLTDVNLNEADLTGANLSDAQLHHAQLMSANLSYANLSRACFSRADFNRAVLSYANLGEASLMYANLEFANLSGTNLQKAFFYAARLMYATLDEANLTEANLWETQRGGWSIRNIICESVYWDEGGKEKTTYQPGEFERLWADKAKIRLFYKDGISPIEIATLPALIKHLEAAHLECGLRLVSIREDSGGAVVELAIENFNERSLNQTKQLQSTLEAEGQQKIEYQRQALIEREIRLQLEGEVRQLNSVVDKLILRPSIYVNNPGGFMGDKFEISGQVGAVGPNAHAHDMTFNQIWNQLQGSIDLPKLADELSRLRQEMKKKAIEPEHDMAVSEIAKAEISAKAGEGSKTLEYLKSAGKWALDIATKIGTSLAVEALKKSLG